MKITRSFCALWTMSVLLVSSFFVACREKEIDNPEQDEPAESANLTPNEVQEQLDVVSENLLSITMDYSPEKEKDLDKIIETIKQISVVKEVRRGDNYIEVIDQDDFGICYPFILPPLFESDGISESALSSMNGLTTGSHEGMPETRASSGGAVVFNFFSEDESRANQNLMIKSAAYNLYSLSGLGSLENIYRKKSEFTADNLYREIHNSSNKVIIVSSHGFDNCIVTGETVTASSFSGWSKKEKQEAMSQNRLVDVGDKDKNGNRLYNKVWCLTAGLSDGEYIGEKLIYFTGCSVMSSGVREALKNVNGIVAGWDGKNSLGEAVALVMVDCLSRMSFKQFYSIEDITTDNMTPGLSSAHLVYAGKSTNFSIKKFDTQSFRSNIVIPKKEYTKVKFMLGSRYIDVGFNIVESDFANKAGAVYLFVERNPSINTTWVTEGFLDVLFPEWWHDWADFWSRLLKTNQCRGYYLKEPGVYKIYLCRANGNHKVEDFYDVKYVLYSSKFKTNYVEAVEKPAPTVGTAVKEAPDDITLYGAQSNTFVEDYENGFAVWEKGKESSPLTLKAALFEESKQVFFASASSLSNATYQAKAYVKDAQGNIYYGNVVEFSVTNNSGPTEPTSGDLVDLGLSVKWASCNIGAGEPQDIGGFYAWGESQTKSTYSWSNYQWSSGSATTLTKYCTQSSYGSVDNKRTLDSADDAAYSATGGKMRMPTSAEWQELIDGCQWTKIQYKGRDGYLVASPVTGNAIFIPCNGFKTQSNYYNSYAPYYWSSDLSSGSPDNAKKMDYVVSCTVADHLRFEGLGIRPVENSNVVDSPETETITVNGVSFKMVKVEGGTFTMGSADDDPDAGGEYSDEKPQHRVTLSTYAIGETEVTQALWKAVMGSNPSRITGNDLPVEEVSWDEAQSFVKKLSSVTGRSFRLPTEAEWEYAARGGKYSKGFRYSGSDDVHEVSWNYDNCGGTTHRVATKKPNELGLYDMSGNVWEWCQDWYSFSYYEYSPSENPCNTEESDYHIHRGGSIEYVIKDLRIAMRGDYINPPSNSMRGLRVVISSLSPASSPSFVDLGLPSGTLWGTCNVGATKPEEFGSYFAWGEVSPKTSYTSSNYSSAARQINVSPISGTEYDPATALLGSDWRMPTDDQMQELHDNCSLDVEEEGLRIIGPNGNSILIPMSGYINDDQLKYNGEYGFLWISDYQSSWWWSNRHTDDESPYYWPSYYMGVCVRPVYVGNAKPASYNGGYRENSIPALSGKSGGGGRSMGEVRGVRR